MSSMYSNMHARLTQQIDRELLTPKNLNKLIRRYGKLLTNTTIMIRQKLQKKLNDKWNDLKMRPNEQL